MGKMGEPRACPICGRQSADPASGGRRSPAPFCSVRCANIDLGRWFTSQYSVPVDADEEVDPPDALR